MFVETFKTDVYFFFGNVATHLKLEVKLTFNFQYWSQFIYTGNIILVSPNNR